MQAAPGETAAPAKVVTTDRTVLVAEGEIGREWKDGLLKFSFWSLNGGLMMMCVLSLLPVGLMQTWASVDRGYWYARNPEFM